MKKRPGLAHLKMVILGKLEFERLPKIGIECSPIIPVDPGNIFLWKKCSRRKHLTFKRPK